MRIRLKKNVRHFGKKNDEIEVTTDDAIRLCRKNEARPVRVTEFNMREKAIDRERAE